MCVVDVRGNKSQIQLCVDGVTGKQESDTAVCVDDVTGNKGEVQLRVLVWLQVTTVRYSCGSFCWSC